MSLLRRSVEVKVDTLTSSSFAKIKIMKLTEITRNPYIYTFVQLLAGGKEKNFTTIRDHMNLKPDETVLDIGCGTGEAARFFPNGYTGIDLSDEYLEFARKKYGDKFKKFNGEQINFPNESFNYIFVANVFHHISDATANQLIKEMKRVCKAGGRVYIADPIWPTNQWNIIGKVIFAMDLGKFQRSHEELRVLTETNGFKVLTEKIHGTFPHHYMVFYYQK